MASSNPNLYPEQPGKPQAYEYTPVVYAPPDSGPPAPPYSGPAGGGVGGAQAPPAPPYAQTIVVQPMFGQFPTQTTCPNCRKAVQTRVETEIGGATWIMCILLFFFTGICCWIPFVVDAFKDKKHVCPDCKAVIGKKPAF